MSGSTDTLQTIVHDVIATVASRHKLDIADDHIAEMCSVIAHDIEQRFLLFGHNGTPAVSNGLDADIAHVSRREFNDGEGAWRFEWEAVASACLSVAFDAAHMAGLSNAELARMQRELEEGGPRRLDDDGTPLSIEDRIKRGEITIEAAEAT